MQVQFIRDFILDDQPDPEQFSYQGFAINVIVREGLSFDLARRSVEVPVIVGEVQRCQEE